MPATGGESRQVFRDIIWLTGHRYNTLGWTSDGRFLMFVRDDGPAWRVSAAGGEPQARWVSPCRVVNPDAVTPRFIPTVPRLVFGVADGTNNEESGHSRLPTGAEREELDRVP